MWWSPEPASLAGVTPWSAPSRNTRAPAGVLVIASESLGVTVATGGVGAVVATAEASIGGFTTATPASIAGGVTATVVSAEPASWFCAMATGVVGAAASAAGATAASAAAGVGGVGVIAMCDEPEPVVATSGGLPAFVRCGIATNTYQAAAAIAPSEISDSAIHGQRALRGIASGCDACGGGLLVHVFVGGVAAWGDDEGGGSGVGSSNV